MARAAHTRQTSGLRSEPAPCTQACRVSADREIILDNGIELAQTFFNDPNRVYEQPYESR